MTDPVTRAYESLGALPILEGGFLRHLLYQAINDPELAVNPALAEHLYLVPRVVRFLPPAFVRYDRWARKTLGISARNIAAGRADISAETLERLALVSLRDPAFLASFLEDRPASPFFPTDLTQQGSSA